MSEGPGDEEISLPPELATLRRLVTGLTAVMIAGFLLLITLLVIRLWTAPAPLALPDEIVLPDGAEPLAVTTGPDWFAIVTRDERILIFDRADGALLQEVEIAR